MLRLRTAPERNLKPAPRSRSLAWKKSRRAASPDRTMTGFCERVRNQPSLFRDGAETAHRGGQGDW